MTCGIYKLNFNNTTKVYIGKSLNIEKRVCAHYSDLRRGTHTKKLMEAYYTYGEPTYSIVLECSEGDLYSAEIEAINIWDAINNGFNSEDSGLGGGISPGELAGNSKFSNKQIVEVLNILVGDPSITYKQIEGLTGVHTNTIKQIARGIQHTWLKKLYPEKYSSMLLLKGTRGSTANSAAGIGIEYPSIISPEGEEFKLDNVKKFCEENGLQQSNLYQVLRGNRKSHKGWCLA